LPTPRLYNSNKAAVDEDLIDIIATPSYDDNALDVFVSVITGGALLACCWIVFCVGGAG